MNELINKYFIARTNSTYLQLFRYFFVGGTAAIIDIGSFMLFAKLFLIDYRIAVFLSFSTGTVVNFILANMFVFDRKNLSIWIAGIRHYISSLGGLLTNELVMILLIGIINFENLLIAKIIATISAFFTNFFLIKFFAFNDNLKLISKFRKNI